MHQTVHIKTKHRLIKPTLKNTKLLQFLGKKGPKSPDLLVYGLILTIRPPETSDSTALAAVRHIGGEARGDRRVVHDVVERRRFDHLLPQLLRLLLRETAAEEALVGGGRGRIGGGIGAPVSNVVGLGGPAEDRGPPVVGSAVQIRLRGVGESGGGDGGEAEGGD